VLCERAIDPRTLGSTIRAEVAARRSFGLFAEVMHQLEGDRGTCALDDSIASDCLGWARTLMHPWLQIAVPSPEQRCHNLLILKD